MRQGLVVKRYGKAVYELAVEARSLDSIAGEMQVIHEAIDRIPFLVRALSDERIKRERRLAAANEITCSLGLGDISANLIRMLVGKNRARFLQRIVEDVRARITRHKNLARVLVLVASDEHAEDVRVDVEGVLGETLGMEVKCDMRVDQSLVGGFVVRVGDMTFDASIMGSFRRMQEDLL